MKFDYVDTTEVNLPEIRRWISLDSCESHRNVDPEFWLPEIGERTVRSKCIAVTREGQVVFYLKLENVMRALIQFPPESERDPVTTSLALQTAFGDVSRGAKHIGYNEIIFESESKGLIDLFGKLGFNEAKNQFLVRL
jgi:hypothetical protein